MKAAFALTGALATAVSVATYAVAAPMLGAGVGATAVRLLVTLPILHLGYSRLCLGNLHRRERARFGAVRGEARMLRRTAIAVGASAAVKLVLEPVLARWAIPAWGGGAAVRVALAGDLVYGPLAAYLTLRAFGRRSVDDCAFSSPGAVN